MVCQQNRSSLRVHQLKKDPKVQRRYARKWSLILLSVKTCFPLKVKSCLNSEAENGNLPQVTPTILREKGRPPCRSSAEMPRTGLNSRCLLFPESLVSCPRMQLPRFSALTRPSTSLFPRQHLVHDVYGGRALSSRCLNMNSFLTTRPLSHAHKLSFIINAFSPLYVPHSFLRSPHSHQRAMLGGSMSIDSDAVY
jgi:hypothetical protein